MQAGSAMGNQKSDGAEQSASRGTKRPKPEPQPVKLQAPPEPCHFPGCLLSRDQNVKVLEIVALANKTGTSLHVASMYKTEANFQGLRVCIPFKLVRHHFIKEKTTAIFQLEVPHKDQDQFFTVEARKLSDERAVIEDGWTFFVDRQHIQESDALIFRSEKNSTCLQVRILDRSGRDKTYPCSSIAQKMCDDDNDDDDDDVRIVDPPAFANSGHGARDRAPVKLEAVSEPPSNNLGGSFRGRYIKSGGGTLSPEVQKEVEEKVQEIGSEFPILVKTMTTSNVNGAYCIMPISDKYSVAACLPNNNQPMVVQMEGKEELWDATLSVDDKERRYIYWGKFPCENQLKVGDTCLLEMMVGHDTGKFTMKVYVIRNT